MIGLSEVGRLTRVAIKPAWAAFQSPARISAQWRLLGFAEAPDFNVACREYETFQSLLATTGAEIVEFPMDASVTMDSIYVRDASIVSSAGMILCEMGKAQRAPEPAAQAEYYRDRRIPIAGAIRTPGRLEGGDLVWLDEHTVIVGHGYRTNAEGVDQLRSLLGRSVNVTVVPLPHWRGPSDVFHLMSMLSPIDRDLAVVYSPLLPVPFRTWLLDRGIQLIDVPDDEFASMGANVLALSPRRCVMLDGNPVTRASLERAGAEVSVYEGREISLKGGGGPTCLTRPIERNPV